MTTHSPPRRRGTALIAVSAMLAGTALLASPAAAAPGTAPAPAEYRVLQDLHTDAVSTFLDDGVLKLDSKADVAEGNGTRFSDDEIWFHVDDDSKMTLPTGYEFIAPNGSEVWIAPQSSPGPTQLWPGFSTESVALGAIDNNSTTFTLVDVEGPGDLERFTTGSFGGVTRIWSSDEPNLTTLTVGRVHMHANWAFTAAGTYDITVEASAAIGGVAVADTATYTFVVGALPERAATTTSLSTSASSIVLGESLELNATVTPTNATGFVEFRDGSTVLGHEPLVSGSAQLATAALGIGSHDLTAAFVPEVANLASTSTSTPVTVSVTEEAGSEEFGLYGDTSYFAGEQLELRLGGVTLAEGQTVQWLFRKTSGESFAQFRDVVRPTPLSLSRSVSTVYDGVEVAARIMNGSSQVATTAAVTLAVTGPNVGSGIPITVGGFEASYYAGDIATITATHRPLEAGETYRWAHRYQLSDGRWRYDQPEYLPQGAGPVFHFSTGYMDGQELALQILDSTGQIIGESAPFTWTVSLHDVIITGVQSVYRAGQTVTASATVLPERGDLYYRWLLLSGTKRTWLDQDTATVTIESTAAMASSRLFGYAYDTRRDALAGYGEVSFTVVDVPEGTQTLSLGALDGHYHQGTPVNLTLVPDPPLSDTDTIVWEWKWPGSEEWMTFPGSTEIARTITAEQGLHGVQVRGIATLTGVEEPLVSTVGTILVDDHGAPAEQNIQAVGAATRYAAGDTVELSASVAPGTIVPWYQWFSKAPGASEAVPIEGAIGPDYSFVAEDAQNGSEISVAVVRPDGSVVYGPSAPTSITVAEASIPSVFFTKWPLDTFIDGTTFELAVSHSPATPGSTYLWEMYVPEAAAWITINGPGNVPVTGSTLGFPANADWDGWKLRVSLVSSTGEKLAVTDERELRIDRVTPAEDGLHILGLAGHYHQGSTINLGAVMVPEDEADATYLWWWKRVDQPSFSVVPGMTGASFTVTAEQAIHGTEVKVERIVGGTVDATSDTVTISVDDHGAAPHQVVSLTGLAVEYTEGTEVALDATVAPSSVLTRWEWYVQAADEDTPMLVTDQHGAQLRFDASAELDGATVFARLTFDDGTAYVESAPVIVQVVAGEPGEPGEETEKPDAAPEARTSSDLEGVLPGSIALSHSEAKQGQVVVVSVDSELAGQWIAPWMFSTPVLLGGDWAQVNESGDFAVRIPVDAPVGDHSIAVFSSDGELIGWAALTVAAAAAESPEGTLAQTGGGIGVGWTVVPALLMIAGALLIVGRRVRAVRQ